MKLPEDVKKAIVSRKQEILFHCFWFHNAGFVFEKNQILTELIKNLKSNCHFISYLSLRSPNLNA